MNYDAYLLKENQHRQRPVGGGVVIHRRLHPLCCPMDGRLGWRGSQQ